MPLGPLSGSPGYIAGILCVLAMGAISGLSSQFVFGEGHESRPIPLFLSLYLVGWIAFAAGAYLIHRGRGPGIVFIIVIGVAMRLVFLFSNPIQENDGYRYILDGAVLGAGGNPFSYTPELMADHAPMPVWNELQRHDAAKEVLSRISYQHVPTIYPPVAQYTFALGHWLMPWQYAGQRVAFLLWDVATIGLIVIVLRGLHMPVAWVAVYAWNPLVVKEVANSAHSDSAAAFFFVAMVGALALLKSRPDMRWAILLGCCFAGAVLARMYPLILAPVCAAGVYRLAGVRGVTWFSVSAAATILIAYLPFLTVPFEQLTAGLQTYGEYWRRNDGAYGVIQSVLPAPRLVVSGITAGVGIGAGVWCLRGEASVLRFVAAMQMVVLTWLLFAPASYPWYAVALLAICAIRPRPWANVLSGAYGAYYLLFLYSYRDYGVSWAPWTQAFEHGVIWAAILIPLLAATRTAASSTAGTATTASTTGEER